jgi:protein-tyrosine phosphatase
MVQAFLAYQLAARGVTATVTSAGLYYDGEPASANAVQVLARKGLDLSGHRSRIMDGELLGTADLVLGMERLHVREAVVLRPDIFPRAFTLKELVRRGEQIGPIAPGEPVDQWVARAHAGRQGTDHLGASPDDDVVDPIGQSVERYEQTARELDDLVWRLTELVFPTEKKDVSA